jgi:hypothetical protein
VTGTPTDVPRLETDDDRDAEHRTMSRLVAITGGTEIGAPPLAAVDRFIVKTGRVVAAVEIKTRKETAEQVRGYGGLMLKHRKLGELQQLARLLRVPTYAVFGFQSGFGAIYVANVERVAGLEPQPAPRRRRYRGLACDDEPVVYLDWQHHLRQLDA